MGCPRGTFEFRFAKRRLPNDPRGSRSGKVLRDLVAELGRLHNGRKKVQPPSGDIRAFYRGAADALKHPLLELSNSDVRAVAAGFSQVIDEERYTYYACAIMPDHAHVLIRKYKHTAEEMIEHLQRASRLRLGSCSSRGPDHPVWTTSGYKVFLDHPDEVRRTIGYIYGNPVKLRRPRQDWPFVTPYDGWPLHPGHSPNSPYVKRLKQCGRYP